MNSVTIIGPTRWASTKAGGDQNGANLRSASYSPNLLNQYSSRTVPRAFDVTGVGFATNTVTVNGLMTYRKGEYFQKELGLGSSGAWWTNIQVQAGGSTTSGYVFTPATPEMFQYDLDGNLTNDGRWSYWWDGENRLTNMIANTTKGPQLNIRFEYDWQGRRIAKKVWNNTAASGSPVLDEKYVYDGWNLIAILNSDLSPRTSFVWGTDLSGTMQGAGGVGGLLAVYDRANGVHFTAFDGNGNVAALVSAATGEPSAQYEYGPFGEVIRATGPACGTNPFRFSTKYQDDETDLLYYGYRYYNASTGRWLSRDPLGEEGGFNVYHFVFNDPAVGIDILGLGTWSIWVGDVSEYFLNARSTLYSDPIGFIVTYHPRPGECPNASMPRGEIVVFQTITPPPNAKDSVPQVDDTPPPHRAPSVGCRLPDPFEPRGPRVNSYADSPTHGQSPQVAGGVFKITAVAVCRSKCKQKRLSTYYFEWDNAKRSRIPADPSFMGQYNAAMGTWLGY